MAGVEGEESVTFATEGAQVEPGASEKVVEEVQEKAVETTPVVVDAVKVKSTDVAVTEDTKTKEVFKRVAKSSSVLEPTAASGTEVSKTEIVEAAVDTTAQEVAE